ncbi:MAG: lipopolysaccharide biosynthesis protein [Hyphomicrobiaceae bacterium]
MLHLKERSIRAGAARFAGLGLRAVLRISAIVVLARLLEPGDFGLVAMVTVLTGVFEIFATGGLAAATVQRSEIARHQVSSLFWMNIAIGLLIALLMVLMAPVVGGFYKDPRVAGVLMTIAPAFIVNSAGVQHIALLQRDLRYVALSTIEVAAESISVVVAIVMALTGWGYWSLVANVVGVPIIMTAGAWIACRWRPGRPQWDAETTSMLWFGGTITANNLIVHGAYNLEKVLLGRYFGPEALGHYGRAYELINLPTQIINSAIGRVAFSGLSRLQETPERFRSYFLKSYALVISITIPTTLFCAALSHDIVLVILGEKWLPSVEIFRLLAPAVLVFGIINPLAWPLQSYGLQRRSLHLAMAIAPIIIGSYLIGIPYGPRGVAIAYSSAMLLWLVPHVAWCLHQTPITLGDFLVTTFRPLVSAAVAALLAAAVRDLVDVLPYDLLKLGLAATTMAVAYAWMLLVVMRQKGFYVDLLSSLRAASHLSGAARSEGSL